MAAPFRSPSQRPACTRRSLLLLALVASVAGCKVGPKYVVPQAPVPPAYKELGSDAFKETGNWSHAKPLDALPRGNWWTIFGDAGLNALEPQVEQANQTLREADANLRAARAEVLYRQADRFPTIGINPTNPQNRYAPGLPYFNPAPPISENASTQYPLQITWEPDLWGQVRRNISAGKEEAQASAALRVNMLLSLQAELATDYFEVRSADAQTRLLNATVAQYRDFLRITTNRYNGGIAVKSDVTQAQSQLQSALVAVSDEAIVRAQFEHAIANLIGKAPAELSLAPAPLPEDTSPPLVPAGLPSQLLERRPDIAAAERRAQEGNEAIGIAQAAFYPSILLSAAAGFQSTAALQSVFSPASVVYSLGPGLAYTFFDGGRRKAVRQESLALFDQDAAVYRQTVIDATQQVEDALVNLRVLSEEAVQQRTGTLSAQESERILNNRYLGGIDTILQVITAQTTALNSERNDIDILRRRMDFSVTLVRALGGGWDRSQLPPQ